MDSFEEFIALPLSILKNRIIQITGFKSDFMETKSIDAALQQMRLMTLAAQGKQDTTIVDQPKGDFATILQDSINRVNTEQKASQALAQSFEAGENTNIEEASKEEE